MLDAFIIEELRRREREERTQSDAPRIELPIDNPISFPQPASKDHDSEDRYAPKRGVVVIDL
jgi:hypothetical protein